MIPLNNPGKVGGGGKGGGGKGDLTIPSARRSVKVSQNAVCRSRPSILRSNLRDYLGGRQTAWISSPTDQHNNRQGQTRAGRAGRGMDTERMDRGGPGVGFQASDLLYYFDFKRIRLFIK